MYVGIDSHRVFSFYLFIYLFSAMKKNSCRKGSDSQSQSGWRETAVSDGGRFKGQAARVTHSVSASSSISDHVLRSSPLLSKANGFFKL